MRKKLQRSYNESEIWLEQQMKLFWEITRTGEDWSLSLRTFLEYWDKNRMELLVQCSFSRDWIGILYQRCAYLLNNETLLGSQDDKIYQAKTILLTANLLQQMEKSDISGLTDMLSYNQLMDEYPIFYKGFIATHTKAAMESHIFHSGFDVEEKDPALDLVVVSGDGCREELHTFPKTTLREFLEFYKNMKGTPRAMLRAKYMGKTLFLSSCGNCTLEELGVTHRSFITVLEVKPPTTTTSAVPTKKDKKKSTKSSKQSNRKKRGGKKSKKKRSNTCNYGHNTNHDYKLAHSRQMSLLFTEAEETFKEIRKRLSNLALKKMPPKDKSMQPSKNDSSLEKLDQSLTGVETYDAKGGIHAFHILVGQVDNLYQSSKKRQNLTKLSTIDLHGCTQEEATKKLDSLLPSWVSTAMMGEHPFVVKVDVVCGYGNQVLSECVAQWIRRNKQVANRPKSFRGWT